MNRTLNNVLLFAAGAVVGSVVTWKYITTKYEDYYYEDDDFDYDEEIDDFEDEDDDSEEEEPNFLREKPPLDQYVAEINRLRYSNGGAADESESKEEDEQDMYNPYVIRPDEYGEIHAYETLSLNYYADGVLTDELDNPIEDADSIVGSDYAEHFGEFDEPHIVYIRNDERKCDYEICRDHRRFEDVVGLDPHPSEDE